VAGTGSGHLYTQTAMSVDGYTIVYNTIDRVQSIMLV
jgi:hypothetical protein